MARTKVYGYLKGPTDGAFYPVAGSKKVHPQGGMWCYLDSSGQVILALDDTATLFGWAIFPTAFIPGSTAASNGYWTSGSAGVDKVFVYTNPNTIFAMPVVSGDVYAQARVGETADLTGVGTSSGAPDGTPQEANLSASSTDILQVMGGDLDNTSIVYVRMNTIKTMVDAAGG